VATPETTWNFFMPPFTDRYRRTPLCAIAATLLAVSAAQASPVSFDISAASLTPGSGYGTDAGANGENGGTRLGVQFTNIFSTQHFVLSNVGESSTFDLATVRFYEPDTGGGANQGIRNDERDALDLVASFNLASPAVLSPTLTASVTATAGVLNDVDIDYAIAWSPLELEIGGARYGFSLNGLSFTNTGSQQTLRATVELLSMPQLQATAVPEPGSFALVGAALVGLGAFRRRA
jgi:hypothetical protein